MSDEMNLNTNPSPAEVPPAEVPAQPTAEPATPPVPQPVQEQPAIPQPTAPMYGNPAPQQPAPVPPAAPTYNQAYYTPETAPRKGKGLSIASLVLGILSIVSFCCCGINILFGLVGLILGIVALCQQKNGMAIAGVITSAIGFVLSIVLVALMVTSEEFSTSFWEAFEEEMENYPYEDYLEDEGNDPFADFNFEFEDSGDPSWS